jgi:hypothetical protein
MELHVQYVDGVQDISTRNIHQVALAEFSYLPGTDKGQTMTKSSPCPTGRCHGCPRARCPHDDAHGRRQRPRGFLVLQSGTITTPKMGELSQTVIRPIVQKNIPVTVAISPFGPNIRSVVIKVNPQKLLAYNQRAKTL